MKGHQKQIKLEPRERVKRIELSYADWKSAVLPLNYTRKIQTKYTKKQYLPQSLTAKTAFATISER